MTIYFEPMMRILFVGHDTGVTYALCIAANYDERCLHESYVQIGPIVPAAKGRSDSALTMCRYVASHKYPGVVYAHAQVLYRSFDNTLTTAGVDNANQYNEGQLGGCSHVLRFVHGSAHGSGVVAD